MSPADTIEAQRARIEALEDGLQQLLDAPNMGRASAVWAAREHARRLLGAPLRCNEPEEHSHAR